jgi:SNF2 family DNA or RNA helicase
VGGYSLIYKPHLYQEKGTQHLLDNPYAALFAQVGLGKSIMTLTAIEWLLGTLGVDKPLIIGPKRVISHTWPSEIKKWDHTRHLKISVINGTEKQRIQALYTKADIYAVSRDMIAWLVFYIGKNKGKWPFDAIILDELSNFKNPSAQRFKAIKRILPYCRRVIGLTGTPAPNQLLGLWAQVYLLDKGQRLGPTFGGFKDEYFLPGARQGHIIFNWIPRKDAEEKMFAKISDICLSMKTADYLDLPPRIDIYEEVELQSYERYKEFKETEVLQLSNDFNLTPVNAASMYSKLLQYCNGAVYRGDGSYEVVDNSKLEALAEDVEALDGDPVFIAYQFTSDYERMLKAIPGVKKVSTDQDIDDWNAGKIPVACAQIQSLAYGINLQQGGNHLYFYGLNWDLEVMTQMLGRIDRQGKTKPTIVKYFVVKDSIEQLVIERLAGKHETQEKLMNALKRYL